MTSENGEIYIKVRACGSSSANKTSVWYHGFHLAIRHVYVYSSANTVDCIQAAYFDPLKGSVLSPMHGNTLSSDFFEEINISPDDRIVSVSGCYSTKNEGLYAYNEPKLQLLTSLKFVTASGKTYGPYGINLGHETTQTRINSFCFKAVSGVRGFHGSTDLDGFSLRSIGIYVQSQAPSVPLEVLRDF